MTSIQPTSAQPYMPPVQNNAVKIDIYNPQVSQSQGHKKPDLHCRENECPHHPKRSLYDCNENRGFMTPPYIAQKRNIPPQIENKPTETPLITQPTIEEVISKDEETPIINKEVQNESSNIFDEHMENILFEEDNSPLINENLKRNAVSFGNNSVNGQTKVNNKPAKGGDNETKEIVKLLNSNNPNEQNAGMSKIIINLNGDTKSAKKLLNKAVFNALSNVVNKDTSKLAGPTPSQMKLREDIQAGVKVTDQQLQLAQVASPMEIAEQNKQLALMSMSLLYTVLINEVEKNNEKSGNYIKIEMSDLPNVNVLLDTLSKKEKTDGTEGGYEYKQPNPKIRATAIEALFIVARPEFENVLRPIFETAVNDENVEVSLNAQQALMGLDSLKNEKQNIV